MQYNNHYNIPTAINKGFGQWRSNFLVRAVITNRETNVTCDPESDAQIIIQHYSKFTAKADT